jgi:large subunit ribosomal protein L3
MALGLLGRKVGMTQVLDAEGRAIPVTALELGPCVVLQLRTKERDGYEAVQLGFADKPRRLATRGERGHVAPLSSKRSKRQADAGVQPLPKANCEPQRYVREFRTENGASGTADGASDGATVEVGQKLTVDLFNEVAAVDVIGMIKGRGTTGVMKAHNYQGMGASHGVQNCHRAPGSVGSHATDRGHSGKIKKGKKMATRWGNERVTIRNLKVVRVDLENNLLLVRGAVPGPNGGYVMVRRTNKLRKADAKK